MRSLTLVALAATAAWAAPALAQTVPDPDPYYGAQPGPPPPAHMRGAPPPGTTWHAPPQGMNQQQRTFVVRRNGPGPDMGPEQRRHVEYRRIERGGIVPQRWWGPQVQVRNWQMYGFPQPFPGGRWIRYYDDALLIDGNGRVYDTRDDWDWDRYGERWGYDGDVPVYVGDGDFQPGRRDYAWAEHYDQREVAPGPQVRERVYVQNAPMAPRMGPPMGPPMAAPMGPPPCARGCGGGYGYGYGYGAPTLGYGPVLVTETTVTEAPVVEQRTIVTYETVRVPVRHHRRHVVRCGCRPVAPPPPPGGGERG